VRVIIAAGRPSSKWGNYLGVPNHLAPVQGVPILYRTVAQALRWTQDVHVTGPVGDPRYSVEGAVYHQRRGDEANEYASTADLWSETDRTVLVLGDVYWTDAAFTTVAGCPDHAFRVFGRAGASRHTGCPYGEIFSMSWWPEQLPRVRAELAVVTAAQAALTAQYGKSRPPGWMLSYRMSGGSQPGPGVTLAAQWNHRRNAPKPPAFVQIDDCTDDFDWPPDYQRHPLTKHEPRWEGP
jgi:hypothetical protein